MTALLSIRAVEKRFSGRTVLDGVSLELDRSEVVCLIGPSGSGKTTLLRCINHLEAVDGGQIEVDGEPVGPAPDRQLAAKRREIGFVFQRFNLWPHMTALQNVMEAPVRVLGTAADQAEAQARELLRQVGLADKRGAYPGKLSGGQQQRVAIARALAMKPKLMLFDEPTSALDPETVGDVLDVMQNLAREGMTMLCATHELGFAREVADRIVMIDEGRVVEEGPPTQFFTAPRSERTRRFLSKIL